MSQWIVVHRSDDIELVESDERPGCDRDAGEGAWVAIYPTPYHIAPESPHEALWVAWRVARAIAQGKRPKIRRGLQKYLPSIRVNVDR